LRLNLFKNPPPIVGDGIEQFSIGTLLQSEKDRENAEKIHSSDLVIDENSPAIVPVDFDWSTPGKAKVSGRILNPFDEPLPKTDIRLEMIDSGFWSQTSPEPEGTFLFSNIPEGRFIINIVFHHPNGWIKYALSASVSNDNPLKLPELLYHPPSSNLKVLSQQKTSETFLYFFGETILLQKTDASGSLKIAGLGQNFQNLPLDDEIQVKSQIGNTLVDQNDKALPNILVATLPKQENWTSRFLFQYPIKTNILLPTSIDCRVAVFSKHATDQQQKTIDLTVFPEEQNLLESLPRPTKLEDRKKEVVFSSKTPIEKIILISETEETLNLPANETVSIPYGSYRVFSSKKTERGKFNRLKSMFSGRVAFIGTTLQEDQDLVSTPINFFDPAFPVLPGVNLHANLFSGLVRNDFLSAVFLHSDRQPNLWPILQALFALPFLLICNRVFFKNGAYWGAISIVFLATAWTIIGFISFLNGILIPLFFPILNFISFGVLRGYYAWEIARRKENETRSTFGRFISSAVVEEILKTPESLKPGGEKKELTIMFTDLAGFTTISEKLAPEQLTELMNEYLGAMTDLLFKHQGTLDKYIGDAIMAFWNHPQSQPNHPELAAKCAIAMQEKLGELRQKWLQQGLPEVQVRAGINTSNCMVGFIGSQVQMNFTCLGDGVNLASRLEGANKNYGTLNMIAESVKQRLDPNVFSIRFLDYLAVKGKDQPIKVYELRGLQKDESDGWKKSSPSYHQGVELYLQRDFQNAIVEFKKVLQMVPEDEPTVIFIDRCRHFLLEPPPENWDGRYILKTK
jgi:class 3 adenylate cyclase